MPKRTCSVDGCENPHLARGWCRMHYQRWKKWGDPLVVLVVRGRDEFRFWSRVDKSGPGGCWIWTGTLNQAGYGVLGRSGRQERAHRFAYELLVGPIPAGLHLDHLCRNPPCVNPAHLEPVTPRENILRGETLPAANAAKTHCANGHLFSLDNTYIRPDGARTCRICHVAALQRWKTKTRII